MIVVLLLTRTIVSLLAQNYHRSRLSEVILVITMITLITTLTNIIKTITTLTIIIMR